MALVADPLQLYWEKAIGRKRSKIYVRSKRCTYKAPIQLYINELILGNNTMMITLNDKRLSLVTYSVFHYLFTRDVRFTTKVADTFDTLLARSTLISKTGEKDRNRFFNTLREKVNGLLK